MLNLNKLEEEVATCLLPSSKQHLSSDDCLEDKTELFWAVLCTTVVHNDTHT